MKFVFIAFGLLSAIALAATTAFTTLLAPIEADLSEVPVGTVNPESSVERTVPSESSPVEEEDKPVTETAEKDGAAQPERGPDNRSPLQPTPVTPAPPPVSQDSDSAEDDSDDSSSGSSSPASLPGVVRNLSVTPGRGQAVLAWTAPSSNGGAAITDYVVEQSTDDTTWTVFSDGTSAITTATVTSLTNGTTYYFRVKATNSVGSGSPTASVSSDLLVTPAAPTGLSITETSRSTAELSWTAPADDGGESVDDYRIQQSTDGSSWTTLTDGVSASTTATVSSLVGGNTYYFRVAAINSEGTGADVSDSIAWTVTPAAPTGLSITAGDGEVTLSWSAPMDDGGATIIDYSIQQSTDGETWTTLNDGVSTSGSATVSSLSNGTTYYFRVAADNAEGTGPYTASGSATPTP